MTGVIFLMNIENHLSFNEVKISLVEVISFNTKTNVRNLINTETTVSYPNPSNPFPHIYPF